MLAGVGGRTIEEAQQNLTHREVIDWIAYRAKFGPLSVQARQERIAAAQMHHLNTIHGGKAKFEDFMIFSQLDEAAQPEATVDDVLMMLKSSAIKKQTD